MGKKNVQNFWISLLVILIYPLLPIFVELVVKQSCLDTTLTITAAVYSITVFTSSNKLFYLFLSFIPALLLTILYVTILNTGTTINSGVSKPAELHSTKIILITVISIIAIAIVHASERYKRHVVDEEQFLPVY